MTAEKTAAMLEVQAALGMALTTGGSRRATARKMIGPYRRRVVVGGRFEEASVIARSQGLGTEESDRCLTTIGNSYNQMIHSKPKITEALGKTCEAWFNNPDTAQFQKLVELFKIFRDSFALVLPKILFDFFAPAPSSIGPI